MRVYLEIRQCIHDQVVGPEMSAGLHDQIVTQLYLEGSHQAGDGWVSANGELDWMEVQDPDQRHVLSMVGHNDGRVKCEVVCDNALSLRSNPLAFLDHQGKIEYLLKQGVQEDMVEGMLDGLSEPDITLRIGENATLVFRGKEELLSFLDQCAEVRKSLPGQ